MLRRCSSRFSVTRAFAVALLLTSYLAVTPAHSVRAAPSAASFGSPVAMATGGTPQALLLHDFEGTGWDDAVISLQDTNTVLFYRNSGTGTGFLPPTSYTVGTGNPADPAADPFAFAVGDFNGDGKDDLAVYNNGQTTLTILQGNGNGAFTVLPIINLHDPPFNFQFAWDIAAGDFNNDGKWDLAITDMDPSRNGVGILLGNGNNTFAFGGLFPTANDPQELLVGDFNGDGKADIVTSNTASNSISVLIGNGNGTFLPHIDYPTGITPAGITRIPIGFEKTFMDLAVANEGSNSVSIFPGNGDGTFQPRTDYPVPLAPFGLSVGFLNPDGLPDIDVIARGSGAVGTLLQDAGSFFFQSLISGSSIGPADRRRARKADGHIFSQHRDDMAVINSVSGNLALFRNTATATTLPPTIDRVSDPCNSLEGVHGHGPQTETYGNTYIFIHGSGLSDKTQVFINGAKAGARLDLYFANGDTLIVTVPPSQVGAVIADVKVVNPDGQFAEQKNGVSYTNSSITPTVTGITPGSGLAGGSTLVTITGTNFAPGTCPLFNFQPATNVVVVNSTTITASTPPAFNGIPGPVDLVVQLPNGVNATLPSAYIFNPVSWQLPANPNRPPGTNIQINPFAVPIPRTDIAPPPSQLPAPAPFQHGG